MYLNLNFIFRYIWSSFENKKISSLVSGLDKSSLVLSTHEKKFSKDSETGKKLREVAQSFENTMGQHDLWAWKFYSCEALTLANLFFQYFMTNKFLGGEGYFQKVALQGWVADEHEAVLPITGSCFIK